MKLTDKPNDNKWYCAHSKPHIIQLTKNYLICDISGFSPDVIDIFVILGCCTAYVDSLRTPITNLLYVTIPKRENASCLTDELEYFDEHTQGDWNNAKQHWHVIFDVNVTLISETVRHPSSINAPPSSVVQEGRGGGLKRGKHLLMLLTL
jgi:hypothetical protein